VAAATAVLAAARLAQPVWAVQIAMPRAEAVSRGRTRGPACKGRAGRAAPVRLGATAKQALGPPAASAAAAVASPQAAAEAAEAGGGGGGSGSFDSTTGAVSGGVMTPGGGPSGDGTVTITFTVSCQDPAGSYNQGFNAGFNSGFNPGFNSGFTAGFHAGFRVGFNDGFRSRTRHASLRSSFGALRPAGAGGPPPITPPGGPKIKNGVKAGVKPPIK
jgi:hypothetical protein